MEHCTNRWEFVGDGIANLSMDDRLQWRIWRLKPVLKMVFSS